jgi:hypothetical protein
VEPFATGIDVVTNNGETSIAALKMKRRDHRVSSPGATEKA